MSYNYLMLSAQLKRVFGKEWNALSYPDRQLIARDCVEVTDFEKYRSDIGAGNLASYAKVMQVRFNKITS